jgi:hypothetical protein
MELNLDSVDPPGNIVTYREGAKSLQWSGYDVRGRANVAFAYASTPIRPGRIQVSAFGSGEFVDTAGGRGTFRLPTSYIDAARVVVRVFTPFLFGPAAPTMP